MYIKIFKKSETTKGVKISNLGNNGDDLLVKIIDFDVTKPVTSKTSSEYRKDLIDGFIPRFFVKIETYNETDYLNGAARSGRLLKMPKKIMSPSEFSEDPNEVRAVRLVADYLKTKLELVENVDFKILAESTWRDNDAGLMARVTMPDEVVIGNANYVQLITKVKALISLGHSLLFKDDDLNIAYFRYILPDDLALIENDPNILIELK